jgi:hypothetical protein
MKFHLAINMERIDDTLAMQDVARHTLEMVQMADQGGFRIAWAAEHHALEMTIAPNPFSILTWWAEHTNDHPPWDGGHRRALLAPDQGGGRGGVCRPDLGRAAGVRHRLGRLSARVRPDASGAEADRCLAVYAGDAAGDSGKLWQGDTAHEGEHWSFPASTSCPKPLQKEVPVWVAARAPITYDYAVKHGCNIQSWPLTRDMGEAQAYMDRLNEAVANNPGEAPDDGDDAAHGAV